MPKERRQRFTAHLPSVKLATRQFTLSEKSEHVEIGQSNDVSGNDILRNLTRESTTHEQPSTKKEKQKFKHDTLLRRLESSRSPYSKSHERRLKRKAKEQIAGGLGDMQAAISAIEKDCVPAETGVSISSSEQKRKSQVELGPIAKGKSTPLSNSQRKRVLRIERLRQPLMLSNPVFTSSPFQAIRTHVENTQKIHEPST